MHDNLSAGRLRRRVLQAFSSAAGAPAAPSPAKTAINPAGQVERRLEHSRLIMYAQPQGNRYATQKHFKNHGSARAAAFNPHRLRYNG